MKKLFLPFQPNFPLLESTMESFDIYGFLNKVVERVNYLQKLVEDFDLEEMENLLNEFKDEIRNQTAEQIAEGLVDIEKRVLSQVRILMNNYQYLLETEIQNVQNDLQEQIDNIVVGEIEIYNPLNGLKEPVETVINDLYDLLRNGITATEFDGLELSATEFDSLEITAYDFDFYGKEILINV